MSELRFPDGFLWGAATSSHQVEGDQPGNDWTDWEAVPGHIHDGTRSGRACAWWSGEAERDLSRAAELGMRAIRISLEWSRLEPERGRFDEAAFTRYRAILDCAARLGMTPLVTLHHFTLPRWVAAAGSWEAPSTIDHFERMAAAVAERLGDRDVLWATMNEPSVLAFMGYLGKAWPPGRGNPLAGFRALRHMLLAHAVGRRAFKAIAPTARVGLVLNVPVFDPARAEKRRDRAAAAAQDWAFTGCVLDALEHGRWRPPLALRSRPASELAGSIDWLGLNYYGRYRVQFDPLAAAELFGKRLSEHTVRTEHNDWGEIYPEGLTRSLVRLRSLGVPLYVTENGLFTHDDDARARYLTDHVRAVHRAIARGADVRGYMVWSLLDNFEWAEGYATPFGLFAHDRVTQSRVARPSAAAFAAICRTNAVSE